MQIDHRAFIFGTAALGIARAARADWQRGFDGNSCGADAA
jgi:hypothetical protein